MKVVIQKVRNASVTVDNKVISQIGQGLLLLIGIARTDTVDDVSKLANKILRLRIFEDRTKNAETATKWVGRPWAKSVSDINAEILCVSQFTLYGNIQKGTKPDFHRAMKGDEAELLYLRLLEELRRGIGESSVQSGKFGAMMDVSLVNDGPVTIIWDTKDKAHS